MWQRKAQKKTQIHISTEVKQHKVKKTHTHTQTHVADISYTMLTHTIEKENKK